MRCRPSLVRGRAAQVNPGGFTTPARRPSVPHRTAGCGKSSLRPLMAGSSPSLPDGSNPSAAIVQSASDVQCSRLLKTTPALIFQGKICRKSRVRKSNLRDRFLRHVAARNPGRCAPGAGFRNCATPSRLPLTRQPDRAPAAVGVFHNMGHNIKAVPVEQQAVFVGVEAGMIEGFPFQRADRLAKGGTTCE